MYAVCILFGLVALANSQTRQLESYVVDPDAISVSGFSSGGAMSTQFHFVNSEILVGAGIFAGSPYLCGGDFLLCLVTPGLINVTDLTQKATDLSNAGDIANVQNVKDSKVFIYHGQNDTSNGPANGLKIREMYANFGADILENFAISAEHSMPTSFYGNACGQIAAPTQFISNCSYEGSFEMLNHLYGNLNRPASYGWPSYPGELLEFNQTDFVDGPGDDGFDSIGLVYIPSGCTDNSVRVCKLHLVFHGCAMNRASIGDAFVMNTGYLEVAELNNIITLFPQATSSATNPGGCWDTWGFTSDKYATLQGQQNVALNRIISRIMDR